MTASGVTQAPSRRNDCGCSPAKGHADVSRIQAYGRAAWATTSTTASPAKTAAPPRQTSHPLSPSPEQDWPLADRRRLCKQASGSRLVRWWTAAQQRRPGVIWSADQAFTVPVSDTRGHAVALAGATALSWEELPVLAGCGLTRANSDERLDGVEPGGRTAPFSRSRSAGGRGAGLPPRPRGFPTFSEFEPGADVHHRCAPGVDRADDLLGVDPLEVHAGRGHIRMPELALDHG